MYLKRIAVLAPLFMIGAAGVILSAQGAIKSNVEETQLEIGIGGGHGMHECDHDELAKKENLQSLLHDHYTIRNSHLQNLYDNGTTSTTQKRLDDSAQELSLYLSKVLSMQEKEVYSIFQNHIEAYESYTNALRENDIIKQKEAKNDLESLAIDLADEIRNSSPFFPKENIEKKILDNTKITLSIMDAHAKEDLFEKLRHSARVYSHTEDLAKTIIP